MAQYQITANGTDMGIYEGDTLADAILAQVKDAGYASLEQAAEQYGQTVDEFLEEIDGKYVAPTATRFQRRLARLDPKGL